MKDFINPQIVGVISGLSTAQMTVISRFSHTLIYKIDGESAYYFKDKTIRFTKDTVLYIPEGESYSFRKISNDDSPYCLINFHLDTNEKLSPKLFSAKNIENILLVFKKMEKIWRLSDKNDQIKKYKNLSLFYTIVSSLLESEQAFYVSPDQKQKIDSAIDYLEKHLFDCDLKISDLNEICGLTAPTLNKIFIARFGVSPKKYVIRQRLMQAKTIIENGEYESINQVALSVGYDDALYFSKLFKSVYGYPPSKLN